MSEVQQQLRRGLVWLGSGSLIARLLDAGTLLVLMWFLSKEELGIATLAWTVTVFVEAFNGLGMQPALVQAKELDDDEPHAAFWYVMGVALVLATIVALLAPLVASFYEQDVLVPLVRLSALKLVFVGAALVPLSLLSRELRFGDVTAVTTSATLLASILTIALAATGWGVWAPVVGNTAHGLFQWIGASIAKPMRPKLVVTTPAFPTRVRFGLKAGIANATYELYRNVDYLIVGRLLGVGPLGIYRVAFDLAMAPVLAVVQVAQRTALPVFSRIADEREGLADAFMYTSRSLALLLVPIVALLYFAGGDLLWWIGGDKWLSAAPALGLLAWAALPRALTHLYPLLLYARGRPGLAAIEALFHLGFLVVVLSVALTMFGDQLGVIAACYAWLVAAPVMLGFDWWLVRRVVRLRVRGYLAALRDPLLGMLLLGLGLWALSSIAPALPEGGIRFGLQLLVGLGLYALFLRGFLHIDPKRLLRSDPAS